MCLNKVRCNSNENNGIVPIIFNIDGSALEDVKWKNQLQDKLKLINAPLLVFSIISLFTSGFKDVFVFIQESEEKSIEYYESFIFSKNCIQSGKQIIHWVTIPNSEIETSIIHNLHQIQHVQCEAYLILPNDIFITGEINSFIDNYIAHRSDFHILTTSNASIQSLMKKVDPKDFISLFVSKDGAILSLYNGFDVQSDKDAYACKLNLYNTGVFILKRNTLTDCLFDKTIKIHKNNILKLMLSIKKRKTTESKMYHNSSNFQDSVDTSVHCRYFDTDEFNVRCNNLINILECNKRALNNLSKLENSPIITAKGIKKSLIENNFTANSDKKNKIIIIESSIGKNCILTGNIKIVNSIICDNVEITSNSKITNCYVHENSKITQDVDLQTHIYHCQKAKKK
ncbi:hypothetical protein A3Q56_06850 [Intoshia linei]|uniref:Translation initiation factor eIF2B subunit gamma n=1 Tax=Intoshia linei TaxID=1819745 RepID=A0A177ATR6_9BILA|nr:hypothetical protein A3Q56_06850 [Intoshia linei]